MDAKEKLNRCFDELKAVLKKYDCDITAPDRNIIELYAVSKNDIGRVIDGHSDCYHTNDFNE